MKTLISVLLLAGSVPSLAAQCSKYDVTSADANSFQPFSATGVYNSDTTVTMSCEGELVPLWDLAAALGDTLSLYCNSDGNFVPDSDRTYSGEVICVTCVAGDANFDCTNGGTCNADHSCDCPTGYNANGRVCEEITCPLLPSAIQSASPDGPYKVNDVVTLTCTSGHVEGSDTSVKDQTITCKDTGGFDPTPLDCIVCGSSADCTNGECVSKKCVCDAADNYILSTTDATVCELVECAADSCSGRGTCEVKSAAIECTCALGTTGTTCAEFEKTVEEICTANPCLNNGVCSRSTDGVDYNQRVCDCTSTGYKGMTCEIKIPGTERCGVNTRVWIASGAAIILSIVVILCVLYILHLRQIMLQVMPNENNNINKTVECSPEQHLYNEVIEL